MQEQVLQKVKQYIAETEMIKQGCTVIAGVSGGPDSMVMLDILRRLQGDYECSLRVVHVNHGIRGKEALRDQKTVQKICREWKIPCCVYSYDVPCLSAEWKMGTEEAGRTEGQHLKRKKRNVHLLMMTYGSHLHITKTMLPRQCSIILREGAASVEWLL